MMKGRCEKATKTFNKGKERLLHVSGLNSASYVQALCVYVLACVKVLMSGIS